MENGDNETDESVYVKVSFIERAPNRREILSLLNGSDVYTPSELAEEADLVRQNVSRVLRELKEKGLAECLNPTATKYRYYEITEQGEKIIELVDER